MARGAFRRSSSNKVIAGVCGGLARYFGMDPTLARILWVVLTLVSFGAGLIGYLLIWLLVPQE
ncbi:MAG: PspC domain-containing protein [Candidatus Thermoplasmatota archaeon]|jgi:phage shock protein C